VGNIDINDSLSLCLEIKLQVTKSTDLCSVT